MSQMLKNTMHWLCKKVLGVQRKKTEDLYTDMLAYQPTIQNLNGVLFLDGNIAPDHFASFNSCQHNATKRKVYARVGGPDVFMFHGVKGFFGNMLVRLGDFHYVIQFDEQYLNADIKGRIMGITLPKKLFHGVILESDIHDVYHRYNPLPTSSANYTLRRIATANGDTLQRPKAEAMLAAHEYRWTGADGVSLMDLPAICVTTAVKLAKVVLP